MTDHSALIERLEAGERGNKLDVLVEVALFEPDGDYLTCRPNNAGTKVVYTRTDGTPVTFLARDWTKRSERAGVLDILRSKAPSHPPLTKQRRLESDGRYAGTDRST